MMRSIKFTVLLFCALTLSLLAAACAPAATPEPTAAPPTPTPLQLPTAASVTSSSASSVSSSAANSATSSQGTSNTDGQLAGASLFQFSCAACHGQDRGGNTFDMDGQKIDVPALAWSDLSSAYATDPGRGSVADQLGLAITKGQDESGEDLNPMMPRWSSLSQAQVDSLVQYLQTADTAAGAAPTLTPAATSLMGEQLYQTACAACHGADGAGKTFEVDGSKITTPSLHWSDLSQMYSTDPSRGSVADQAALAITKGQDESGEDLNPMMPRWSFLSQDQVNSLVQYLQTAFP